MYRKLALTAALAAFSASLLLSAASAGASQDGLTKALARDLQSYLTARAQPEHISALSMTVSFPHDARRINLAIGRMRYGSGPPITTSSLFQIGSNTKAFTSVALLKEVAAGRVSLNDTVGKWFPQYPAWKSVTVRQLLDMTSGIPTYDYTAKMEADYAANPYIKYTPEQLIAYVYPTIKTPGAAYEYSNTGYILAQMLVAKAAPSHSYEMEIDRIIAGENLDDTYYAGHVYPPTVMDRLVSGYEANTDDKGLAKLLYTDTSRYSLSWAQGAGAMVSTPEALTAWVRRLFEGKVLERTQMRELESLLSTKTAQPIARTSASDPRAFALGVSQMYDPHLGRFWFYEGSTIGYRAMYVYLIDDGLIITVFTNSQPAAKEDKLHDLIQTIYGDLRKARAI